MGHDACDGDSETMRYVMTTLAGTAAFAALLVFAALSFAFGPTALADTDHHEATPSADVCGDAAGMATPGGGMPGMNMDMDMGTPTTGMSMGEMATPGAMAEFDQLYIDMMIPHHESIIAMAETALPRLTDERLREIAEAIIATQEPEIAELRDLRARFYGSGDPAAMDGATMAMMDEAMPDMGSMVEMARLMDSSALVSAMCAADDVDLTFIELTIAHHEMAVAGSETALDAAVHPELRDVAERVIVAQEREIKTLTQIRQELTGGTPAASR